MSFVMKNTTEKPPDIVQLPEPEKAGQQHQDFARAFVVIETPEGLQWREKTWLCVVGPDGAPVRPLAAGELAGLLALKAPALPTSHTSP